MLDQRRLDSFAQRFVAGVTIEQAGDGAQERALEGVLIPAVVAELEVLANARRVPVSAIEPLRTRFPTKPIPLEDLASPSMA